MQMECSVPDSTSSYQLGFGQVTQVLQISVSTFVKWGSLGSLPLKVIGMGWGQVRGKEWHVQRPWGDLRRILLMSCREAGGAR